MDSSFAELPDHILSSCLRLTTFAAKLRCQQVCTSWRSLLNRSAASGDACEASTSSSWGRSLMLYVSAPTEALARTRVVDLGYKQATMDLITTAGPLSVHNEACLHWVAQRAMDFPYVRIQIREVLPAQLLAQLATALKAAAALAPSGWQLQLDAGKKTRATKLQLRKADTAASLQVLSKLCKCPNPESYSTVLCRFRHYRSSNRLSTACRGAEILESRHSIYTATFLSDTFDSAVLFC